MKNGKLLKIVVLTTLTLGLQFSGLAQENLVNFYDWTAKAYPPEHNFPPMVSSANSAVFVGNYNAAPYGPAFFQGILTGNLETTPGISYEVSFTMQNGGQYYLGNPSLSFGDFNLSCDLLAGETIEGSDYHFAPENYDFMVTATAAITAMTFNVVADNGQVVFLSNVSVKAAAAAAPEPTTLGIFGFGGGVWVLAQRWRRLFPKRERI